MVRQGRTEKHRLVVLVAVVVIATLQEACDHSRYITITMTAIATAVVQTTVTLTTTKTTVASSSASRFNRSTAAEALQHVLWHHAHACYSITIRGKNTAPASSPESVHSHSTSLQALMSGHSSCSKVSRSPQTGQRQHSQRDSHDPRAESKRV